MSTQDISPEDARHLVELGRHHLFEDNWRPMTVDNVAFWLRIPRSDASALMERLVATGLVEHRKVDLRDDPKANPIDTGFDIYRRT